MNLRQQAESDLAFILEDKTTGFAFDITLTAPDGTVFGPLQGMSGDIGKVLDVDTGQAVSGRQAHIALRISSVLALGATLPEGIVDKTIKPWLATFDDINGQSFTLKIVQTFPDRTIGLITALLEAYRT